MELTYQGDVRENLNKKLSEHTCFNCIFPVLVFSTTSLSQKSYWHWRWNWSKFAFTIQFYMANQTHCHKELESKPFTVLFAAAYQYCLQDNICFELFFSFQNKNLWKILQILLLNTVYCFIFQYGQPSYLADGLNFSHFSPSLKRMAWFMAHSQKLYWSDRFL